MIEHKLNRMYIYISRCERLLTKWCNYPPDLVLLKVCILQMICCSDLPVILLMAEILHQLIGSFSHYLQGFIHPRWLFGISAINSQPRNLPGFSTKVLPGDRRLAAYGRAATQLQVQPGRGQGAKAWDEREATEVDPENCLKYICIY